MASGAYRTLLQHELAHTGTRSGISVLSLLLADASSQRASDIHIDPFASTLSVRFRIDGSLFEAYSLPVEHHAELIARLKIISGLRIDEHAVPQDGRFRFSAPDGCESDARLSILPSQHGECAVIRLLLPRSDSLFELGMRRDQAATIEEALDRAYGLILICGPTGSGKTTTLYGAVRHVAGKNRAVVTIEDPIEYSLPGIRQIQVAPRFGLTFATGLRAVLRQDPDIIVVGEIRDAETADIAMNAAHTGHLVISTIHATEAVMAGSRLEELGISQTRFVSLRPLVIGQKLVPVPCPDCPESIGCSRCRGTGYCGRRGEFELQYA